MSKERKKVARSAGNPRSYPERFLARLPAGTLAQMTAALDPDELLADLVRGAIARELQRRKAQIR